MKHFKILNILSVFVIVLFLSTAFAYGWSTNKMMTNANKPLAKASKMMNKKPVKNMKSNKAQTVMVKISNYAFDPKKITIHKGDTVIWTNMDSMGHTVTSKSFDSGNLVMNATFKYTFNKVGTFDYVCSYHPNMTATVVVK